jgi:hypothetical protein
MLAFGEGRLRGMRVSDEMVVIMPDRENPQMHVQKKAEA